MDCGAGGRGWHWVATFLFFFEDRALGTWKTGWPASSRVSLSVPSMGILGTCCCMQLFLCGCWMLNSDPWVYTAFYQLSHLPRCQSLNGLPCKEPTGLFCAEGLKITTCIRAPILLALHKLCLDILQDVALLISSQALARLFLFNILISTWRLKTTLFLKVL